MIVKKNKSVIECAKNSLQINSEISIRREKNASAIEKMKQSQTLSTYKHFKTVLPSS